MAHPWGTHLSKRTIAELWVRYGGPRDIAGLMAEIAYSESGGWTHRTSPTGCKGLFQICPGGSYDVATNIRQAINKAKGDPSLGDWTKFNPTAAHLVAQHRTNPAKFHLHLGPDPGSNLPFGFTDPPGSGGDLPDIPNPGEVADAIPKAIEGLSKSIAAIANAFKDAFDWLTSSETWLTIGKITIGAALIYWALSGLAGQATGGGGGGGKTKVVPIPV